jgi:hypothetical protein
MEIDGSDVDVRVDADLNYLADLNQLRMTFGAHDAIWALRFGSEEQYKCACLLSSDNLTLGVLAGGKL